MEHQAAARAKGPAEAPEGRRRSPGPSFAGNARFAMVAGLQRTIGNRAVARSISGGGIIRRYTNQQVKDKSFEIWQRNGSKPGQTKAEADKDWEDAKKELRAYEVWESKGKKTGQTLEEMAADHVQAVSEVELGHKYYREILAGAKPWAPTPVVPGATPPTKAAVLDAMQAGLSNEDFARVAAELMLSLPSTVVDSAEAKQKAVDILNVQLFDKGIARNLIDKEVSVVVIPRNKKMTDVVGFESLRGTKTFDGRTWDEVRGSGGFKVPGKTEIFVAITEENLTGKDAIGPAAGTQWCYNKGYSTSSHEMAHVVDNYGLSAKDKAEVDKLYKEKRDLAVAGTEVEWIDGFDFGTAVSATQRTALSAKWDTALGPKLLAKGLAATHHAGALTALKNTIDSQQPLAPAWAGWLVAAGAVNAGKDAVMDPDTMQPALEIDSKLATAPQVMTRCYASSHRLEYFAQSANAYLGTNTGKDPYTTAKWTAAGKPEKGTRRNGRSEVARIEPELVKIFDRVFNKGEVKDANPRAS